MRAASFVFAGAGDDVATLYAACQTAHWQPTCDNGHNLSGVRVERDLWARFRALQDQYECDECAQSIRNMHYTCEEWDPLYVRQFCSVRRAAPPTSFFWSSLRLVTC